MRGAATLVAAVLAVALLGGAAMDDPDGAALASCGGPPTLPGQVQAAPPDANVIAAFRRAVRDEHPEPKEQLALWEAGLVESGLHNLDHGDADSLGALQERASIYGREHALNPYASAVRFLREARALRPHDARTPGIIAADVQRPRADLRGKYDDREANARKYLVDGVVPDAACEATAGTFEQADAALILRTPGIVFLNPGQRADMAAGGFDPRFLRLLRWIGTNHQVVVTALRRDHRPGTNHEAGRAADLGIVDGKLCSPYGPSDPCGKLLIELARLPEAVRPTELIGAFDPDGPGPAWEQSDHHDHLHVGFDASRRATR